MSMSDPIADLLTRIRNGLNEHHATVEAPASRVKEEICGVLEREGYIAGFKVLEESQPRKLQVKLKYRGDGVPVIQGLKRVSKPSLRVYSKSAGIRPVLSGLGIAIVSTSKGVMTNKQAREANVGGEVLCEIW
jgi:small subunit ribosomal protein S8